MIKQDGATGAAYRPALSGQTKRNPAFRSLRSQWRGAKNTKKSKRSVSSVALAWRGTAEFVSKYFAKGQEIAVEGKLTTREWDDDNGQKRSVIELVVNQAHFCGSKSQNQGTGSAGAAPARTGSAGTSPYSPDASADAPQFEVLGEGDELPF